MAYYASNVGKANGLKAGEDRCCGDSCGAGLSEAELTEGPDNFGRNLYYDVGAVAVAFAVKRASSTSAGPASGLPLLRPT